MRFPLAVIEAIRRAVGPKFPIEIRLSGSEVYEGGYDTEYGIRIAQALDGKVDLLHISAGSHEDARVFTVTHPSMFLEDGVNVKYAADIKKHVQTPVATVGALFDPAYLEEIIASGQADVVELARGLIADPDIPLKARTGREDEIVPCLRCFTCFSSLMTRGQFCCALNPEISNEHDTKFATPPVKKKKVLVAGGGIGGMQAALTASAQGHEVILCEKGPRLGGVLRCEDKVPFKKHLAEYLDRQERVIARSPIELRLNTAVTPELVQALEPDVLIAALGAKPAVPPIPGIEKTISAEAVYEAPEKAGQRLVILGGGLVGCELAIYMAGLGRKVTVLEMAPAPNFGWNLLQGQSIRIEFDKLGIELKVNTKVKAVEDGAVLAEGPEGETRFEADTVVSALGMVPLREEAAALALTAPEFYQLGDCLDVKNIYAATNMAYQIARDIGRN
jgi:NADPH-dependent 2,4-dienoyl-CoA reductase/sulfur reductase-like enzyme